MMTQDLEKYLQWALVQYDHLKQIIYVRLLAFWPRFELYNSFERFVILNLLIIGIYLVLSFISSFTLKGFYVRLMKMIYDLPPIRRQILKEKDKMVQKVLDQTPANMKVEQEKIPYKPVAVTFSDQSQRIALKGKSSGNRYAHESHSKLVVNLSKLFAYSNPLHIETFPLVKQMEVQVIAMTAEAIGLKDEKGNPCGTLNSGGTQSIVMAIYAYREYKMKECGVTRPNMVICESGHVAGIKACKYMDIEIRVIPMDSKCQMNISKMKKAIDSQTICVYASYPNYPFGTADDISVIAPYCHKRGVPVHLDMCLGGFVAPFVEKDWKVPQGVTSISADIHKYGLAAKGASVLLFSSDIYRKHQFFVTSFWPGGLYGTHGIAGSRSGVFVAASWISLMKLGRKGLEENAKNIHQSLVKLSTELEKVGYQILSKHNICVLALRHKSVPLNDVQIYMKDREWGFSVNQNPFCMQFSLTPASYHRTDEMLADLKACVEDFKKNPTPKKEANEIKLYGSCTQIKDNGKKQMLFGALFDVYIDLRK